MELEKEYVQDVYETIAEHFSVTRQYKWDWVEKFRDKFSESSRLYDIGCGNGRNMGRNTIGVDNCESFIAMCKADGKDALKGCMTDLPIEDNVADGVQCIAAFHHLSNEERRIKGLLEMKRIMKDDGLMLLSVWSKEQPKKTRRTFEYGDNYVPWKTTCGEVHMRYYYIFDLDELKELFKKVGLEIVDYEWSCGNEVFTLRKA